MKTFVKSKVGRIILIILGIALIAVLFVGGYEVFKLRRQNDYPTYYGALMNKPLPYTEAEMDYLVAVKRYQDPLFFNEKAYRKAMNSGTQTASDQHEKTQLLNWADSYQKRKPQELKANESWLPGTAVAVSIPKNWEQTYKDRQAPTGNFGKYILILNHKGNSGAFAYFKIIATQKPYNSVKDYAASKEGKKFAKINKSQYVFAQELKRQEQLRFNRSIDNVANSHNLINGFITYAPVTIHGRTVYAYQQTMPYTDGDVIESIYLFKIGNNIISANTYYRAKDQEKFKDSLEQAIAKAHTFELDYMRKDEPKRHGITKEEEKRKQEQQ
ncbi:hypothetical protein ACVR0O_02535 [Streptococcus caviae]|uniref:hypothetical protein n=1 Tax=Streptococcus sp. 'caviae' TaxID=1915004 RepID=UPI00094BA90E|nr:hypothetical protein [Streptococcus sp. 'caviae']OLN83868.1 hypothetical protein BMI76_04095 [Streptococcus sp. 'caviae']